MRHPGETTAGPTGASEQTGQCGRPGSDGTATPERGRALVRSVDVLLALIGVALLSMLIQY